MKRTILLIVTVLVVLMGCAGCGLADSFRLTGAYFTQGPAGVEALYAEQQEAAQLRY